MTASPLETTAPPRVCLPRELVSSTVFLLGRLGWAVKTRAIEAFEAEGFSPYHYAVLTLLDESARQTQAEIADTLRIDRSQLVGMLDFLEERRLIERQRDPSDRRRHVVKLTPEGKEQLARLRSITSRIEEEVLAPLAPEDREALHRLLLRVACHGDARFVTDVPAGS